MKYSEIKLDDNQKTLLTVFKASGYKIIGNDDMNGLIMSDHSKAVSLYGLKDFDWIETNSYYEIDKLLNPPKEPKTVWDLKNGDTYWLINSRGRIYPHEWRNDELDVEYRNQGNVFLTKKEAKFESKRREVVTKVRKYARPFECEGDNWYPYWSYRYKEFDFISDVCIKCNIYYFDSEASIQKAIAEVGEDDFKKYYLGVTE